MKKKPIKKIILITLISVISLFILYEGYVFINNKIVDSKLSYDVYYETNKPYINEADIYRSLADYESIYGSASKHVQALFEQNKAIVIFALADSSCGSHELDALVTISKSTININYYTAGSGYCAFLIKTYMVPIDNGLINDVNKIKLQHGLPYKTGIIETIIQLFRVTKVIDDPKEYHEDKPILYLYPQKDTLIKVEIKNKVDIISSYPKYNNYWSVLAKPNGDLYDANNKYYYGLYWDEKGTKKIDFSKGFYVTKDNAITFLETKLYQIGLNAREANEFIMYWLPILEKNGKNIITFEFTNEKESSNPIIITPKPDSLLRFTMHIKKVSNKKPIIEQEIPTFNRTGFTAIEWGGVVHKN